MTVGPFHRGFAEEVGLQRGFKGGEGDGKDRGASLGRMLYWGRKQEAWGHSARTAARAHRGFWGYPGGWPHFNSKLGMRPTQICGEAKATPGLYWCSSNLPLIQNVLII